MIPATQADLTQALSDALAARDITPAEFARRLGVHRTSVDRMLDPKHHTPLDAFEAAFGDLGLKLEIWSAPLDGSGPARRL